MPKIYSVLLPFILLFLLSCAKKEQKTEAQQLNSLAENYVRLGLTIGQYDADFVDAYYGPDSLKTAISKSSIFPKELINNQKDYDKTIEVLGKESGFRSYPSFIQSFKQITGKLPKDYIKEVKN